ncbi:MAG: phytanoyl-CoA dioxygenase family protein [Pseudonocardia sp.]|uniref:phytanoyl-CoA dioxygenase family protein n=1 Tax=unclassified Pseudonocardia TaxID=2619320 RepID=UPI000868FC77|nr:MULTISPECIES: phytanoyl-CoA dioxygenase family protein [unclassified Pseudonocardia]MBN9108375.1 phytanoyl-CoA dioxygenase family protein [Pseudonocardia sp.]ODU30353.1 MAG: hypothetical protein ABS80_00330 [Pseudonocardia sp. SCN 72-51]ODV08750.1 MAG: hypothetical protein ABT15_02775 [Pseudonocardia sp. SCN 73-27]
MTADTRTGVGIREVTPDEVSDIEERGWTFLPGLVPPDVVERLLETGRSFVGPAFEGTEKEAGRAGYSRRENANFANYYRGAFESDICAQVALCPQLGRNAALLLGRDMRMRYHSDLIAVKLPKDMETTVAGNDVTVWHQDVRLVRTNCVSFWISLTENTPEMGTMRYRDGSHKLGELYQPLEDWPQINRLPLSEPLTYQPGDATAHVSFAVHGAPQNLSQDPRWAYICAYLPADAPLLGIPSVYTDEYVASGELVAGKPLDHPAFPVVYDPATGGS